MNHTTRTELHLHTKLSDDISVIEPKEALEFAVRHSCKAIAFTNLNNVQDFPEIAKAHSKIGKQNIKVIYGAEIRYISEDGKTPYGATVLVKNQAGIKGLYKIISSIDSDSGLTDLSVLQKYRDDLLIGSCGNMGKLYEAIANGEDAKKTAAFYDYFEIYPTDNMEERAIYQEICKLGDEMGVPVVASGNCHYIDKEDEICRRVVRTVGGYKDDNKKLYMHKADEMLDEFSYLGTDAAFKTVVTNTNRIADRIEDVSPLRDGWYMPTIENAYEQMHDIVYTKAKEIYGKDLPAAIAERLETELKFIKKGEFAAYYLIAHLMVKHMNDLGYSVGTRGTIGSVLAAFFLGITDTNPMPAHYYCPHCHHTDFDVHISDGFDLPDKICPVCGNILIKDGHNIPFEICMGYAGEKVPDIDFNFPVSKQYDAFAYMQELFGADRVAHAGTIATLWERFAEGYITVYEAKTSDYFTKEQRMYIREKLCGVKRGEGIHPGGILIIPEGMEFEDFTPLRRNANPSPIKHASHFEYHFLHDSILKLDVLGHDTPDKFRLLEEFTGRSVQDVPWNDPEIYELFARADTTGIPAFDSDFMKEMLLKTKPGCFADLVQLSGMSHGTGTWNGNGEELFHNGHALGELPAHRDDVFLQLMKYGIDRKDAYMIAEYVRKGKFHSENETTAGYARLMEDAGVPDWYINALRKIRYMFPKAHDVSYVMNSVRMAWFKMLLN